MICRHCQRVRANRPRGLCWACYYKPGVKELYPPTSKFAPGGIQAYLNPSGRTPDPTDAEPGSAEKVEAMRARAALGQSLFHPDDAKEDGVRTRARLAAVALALGVFNPRGRRTERHAARRRIGRGRRAA